nr:hypothetical protein [Tanacetum cinerariifolium]
MDKIRRDKRKEVHARLDFRENPRKSRRVREGSQNSSTGTLPARYRNPSKRPKMRDRLKYNDEDVFASWVIEGRAHSTDSAILTHQVQLSLVRTRETRWDRSHSRGRSPRRGSSSRYRPQNKNRPCGIEESYGNTRSSYMAGDRHGHHARDRDRSRSMKKGRESESRYLACRRAAPAMEDTGKQWQKGASQQEADAALKANIQDFCEEHYEDILPVIMDKIRRDKRKEVHARLDFRENPRKSRRVREGSQNSSTGTLPARYRNPSKRPKMRDRLKYNDEDVFASWVIEVEDVLPDGDLLADIVLKTKTAPVALKNHMVIPAPPTWQGTGMDITLVTGTALVA